MELGCLSYRLNITDDIILKTINKLWNWKILSSNSNINIDIILKKCV